MRTMPKQPELVPAPINHKRASELEVIATMLDNPAIVDLAAADLIRA